MLWKHTAKIEWSTDPSQFNSKTAKTTNSTSEKFGFGFGYGIYSMG